MLYPICLIDANTDTSCVVAGEKLLYGIVWVDNDVKPIIRAADCGAGNCFRMAEGRRLTISRYSIPDEIECTGIR